MGSEGVTFTDYKPAKLPFGKPHPDPVVETASLGAVEPPDVTYELQLDDLVESGALSGLQLESIVYACQRHEQFLPDRSRCAFFIGDGELCVPANNTSPSTLFALRCMCVVWAYFDQFGSNAIAAVKDIKPCSWMGMLVGGAMWYWGTLSEPESALFYPQVLQSSQTKQSF